MTHPKWIDSPRLLTTAEVGKLFGVTAATVQNWTRRQLLPYQLTAGGHRRYRPIDVEKFSVDRNVPLNRPLKSGLTCSDSVRPTLARLSSIYKDLQGLILEQLADADSGSAVALTYQKHLDRLEHIGADLEMFGS